MNGPTITSVGPMTGKHLRFDDGEVGQSIVEITNDSPLSPSVEESHDLDSDSAPGPDRESSNGSEEEGPETVSVSESKARSQQEEQATEQMRIKYAPHP